MTMLRLRKLVLRKCFRICLSYGAMIGIIACNAVKITSTSRMSSGICVTSAAKRKSLSAIFACSGFIKSVTWKPTWAWNITLFCSKRRTLYRSCNSFDNIVRCEVPGSDDIEISLKKINDSLFVRLSLP